MGHVIVTNRLLVRGIPPEMRHALQKACTHSNPEYHRRKSMGMYTHNVPRTLATWHADGDDLLLPRGATERLRSVAKEFGVPLLWVDKRVSVPAAWPEFDASPGSSHVDVRGYQVKAEEACRRVEQGIVRSPTGSGKTHVTLSLLAGLGQRSLVIVCDRQLLEQWADKARRHLRMDDRKLGLVYGGKKHRIGECLTVALQQTLYSSRFDLESFAAQFGAVAVDEVQRAAAATVSTTIDAFPARYRFGFSADETRKDKKEFLIYDLFGQVLFEITRDEVERSGFIVPVVVRLVPTEFRADWYRNAPPAERDYKRLLDEMIVCPERNALIRHVVLVMIRERRETPSLVFTHRVDHGHTLSKELLAADGVASGLMMGGDGAVAFAESRTLLEQGRLDVAFGTFNAIGTGIDLPSVRAGIVATPLGRNRQFFNQVRGRLCRPVFGKEVGHLYYLWDREVFPYAPRDLVAWNDGNVEVLADDGTWQPVEV